MPEIVPSSFEFETERLRVRPLIEGDLGIYRDLYTDAATMRFISPPLSAEQAEISFVRAIAHARRRPMKGISLVMLDRLAARPVGICGMSRFEPEKARIEAGILLRPEMQSIGLGYEALTALLKTAFAALLVDEIRVRFSAENDLVRRLNIRVGFTPCSSGEAGRVALGDCLWSVQRCSWGGLCLEA